MEKYGKVIKNANLKNYNTYKIESKSKYLIEVDDLNKLKDLIIYLNENNLKYFIIGNGSNIILPVYYDGVIIKLNINNLIINNNKVEVSSSYMINKLAIETVNHNLKGLEWASGIPGTVGASIIGNANCYDGNLMSIIEKIDILENNEFKTITLNDFEYSYRFTSLKERNIIILKVYFELEYSNKEELLELIKIRTQKRIDSQPLEYPSAGSVFRNPEGDSSGRLIEEIGLKGYNVGGAYVSEKHANFIINKNNATSEDIIKLINIIKEKIKEKYGIELILEQEIIL